MPPLLIRPDTVRAVETLLRQWIGLDVAAIGAAAIERAVRQRMEAGGVRDERTFLARLAGDATERDRLVDEVVVPESWFFRDPQAFDFVRGFVAALAAGSGRERVRILCAPCAGGEEPYSVAISLLDAGLASDTFTIDAVDVSPAALERAAAARYSPNAFRTADLSFRDRWFRADDATAVLDDRIRQLVHFTRGNLLDDSLAADRERYDVIFCRNLLIYLTAESRQAVERLVDRLLAANGVLVLGAAEPAILKGSWCPAASNSMFTLRRGPPATQPHEPRPASPPPPARSRQPPRPGPVAAGPTVVPPAAPPQPAANVPAAVPPAAGTDPEAVLAEAGRLANADRCAEALDICRRHEEQAGPSAAVCFMMGILHQSAGDLDRAEACMHKAVYLDPHHEDALLALSLLAAQRGDAPLAEQYRRSSARILARKGMS